KSDLPLLAQHFLSEFEAEIGPRHLRPSALSRLATYGWPGNVRELRNVLYRAALRAGTPAISAAEITDSLMLSSPRSRTSVSSEQARALVDSHGGNLSAAARQLGVARSTFRGWIRGV